jgi:hypothetical protein
MEKVNIELTVQEWNIVMNALGGRPFAEVVEVIGAIRSQADAKLKASAEPAE